MAIKQGAIDKQVQHVVAVPYPAQGHINPMLQLCHQLAPLGFTFTFVNTHHIHQRVQTSSASPTRNNLADAGHDHFPAHDQDSDHIHDAKHASNGLTANAVNIAAAADAHAHANGVASHVDGGQVMQILSQHGLKECNPIQMVFVEGGCPPEQHAQKSTAMNAFSEAQAMKDRVEQLISNVMEKQPVAFILTDVLLGWANSTASKFGLPWVSFWPASAVTCAMFIHFADVSEQGKLIAIKGKQDGEVPVIDDIPGLPPTSLNEMPKVWDDTGKLHHTILTYFSAMEHASFLLLNTFSELEGQAVAALAKRCPTLTVGPLLPSRFMISEGADAQTCPDKPMQLGGGGRLVSRPASLFREDRTCLDWLDTQAPSSVLFISFGSISARTEEQLEELAQGVEASGCPFLWVRRPGISADSATTDSGRRPAADAAQHAENGLIVSWAPQLEVLSHAAVGGFITHCGWNSVMESVAMGVPMLCWADSGERMSNQRFVVQFWKCGLDMVADSSKRYEQHIEVAVLVRREEIEAAIRCLMREESGAPIRARAAQLRDTAISAFRDSSRESFNHFVQAMQCIKASPP